jgi:hypothetical protein
MTSCASSSVTKIGTGAYAPLAPGAEVAVFTAESQTANVPAMHARVRPGSPDKIVRHCLPTLRRFGRRIVDRDVSAPIVGAIS